MDAAADSAEVRLEAPTGSTDTADTSTLSLTGVFELADADIVTFDCFQRGVIGTGQLTFDDRDIVAIQVDALH